MIRMLVNIALNRNLQGDPSTYGKQGACNMLASASDLCQGPAPAA
jgi:hypothetical protein